MQEVEGAIHFAPGPFIKVIADRAANVRVAENALADQQMLLYREERAVSSRSTSDTIAMTTPVGAPVEEPFARGIRLSVPGA